MDSKESINEIPTSTAENEKPETAPPTLERESTGNITASADNAELEHKHTIETDEDDIVSKKRKLKADQTKNEPHSVKEELIQKKDERTSMKEKEEHLKSKTNTGSNTSLKSTTSFDNQDTKEGSSSPEPKVPPLKIVLPPAESEQNNRNGKNGSRHHPYVVSSNEDTSTVASLINTTASSPASPILTTKDKPSSPSLSTIVSSTSGNNPTTSMLSSTSNEDQRSQQRVLRSALSNKSAAVSTSGVSSSNSSPSEAESSLQEIIQLKDEQKTKNDSSKSKDINKGKLSENTTKVKTDLEEESFKPTSIENRNANTNHMKDESSVEVHPRKRKFKAKPEPMDVENDHSAAFGSALHPHEVPVTNCYQMFMDIRRQIDVKRKGLFSIQPKPPQGFKDYLMNRCTYTLQKDPLTRFIRLNAEPPEGLPEALKEFFQEQESERYTLRMQHVVEKEKLVLSVEQEILRVHGRAARALANQALPFSACTILKDEEVYNVITPEQEEKDRNARSRYNGRLFISWLQDVDDKWEKIKEEMLARQRKEAESLNAVQKFNWDIKMRELGLWKKKESYPVEPNCVPTLAVNEEFDLIY